MRTAIPYLLVLLGLLTATLAFHQTPIKSLLLFEPNANISPINPLLIGIRQGSISFAGIMDAQSGQRVPEYLLMNFESRNASKILQNITAACDNCKYAMTKLLYHHLTSTLVYYCTNNNTVLILDEDNFTVQDTIVVDVNVTFQETRLGEAGNMLSILGNGEISTLSPNKSQLIKVDMTTAQVVDHIIFDKGLGSREIVLGYASGNSSEFLVTRDIGTYTGAVYRMTSAGGSYSLVKIYTTPYTLNTIIPELSIFGDFIATNDKSNLLFLNSSSGVVVQTLPNIAFITRTDQTLSVPMIVRGYKDNVLYVTTISNSAYQSLRFNITAGHITSQIINKQAQLYVAVGNHDQSDLLLLLDSYVSRTFHVLNADTSSVVYAADDSIYETILTNSTYTVLNFDTLNVYSLTNEALLASVKLTVFEFDSMFYHDKQAEQLYYMKGIETVAINHVEALDLKTGQTRNLPYGYFQKADNGFVIQARTIDANNVDLVIQPQSSDKRYIILTKQFGRADFTIPSDYSSSRIVVDFDTLSVTLIASWKYQEWDQIQFTYNSTTKTFTQVNLSIISGADRVDTGVYFPSDDTTKVYGAEGGGGPYAIFDLSTVSATNYLSKLYKPYLSTFYDIQQQAQLIVSESPSQIIVGDQMELPYLLVSGTHIDLPGVNQNTFVAKAAGRASYFTVDQIGSSVKVLTMFSVDQKTERVVQ